MKEHPCLGCGKPTTNPEYCSKECQFKAAREGAKELMELASVKNFFITREHLNSTNAKLDEKFQVLKKEYDDMKDEIPLFKDQPFTQRMDSMIDLRLQVIENQESIISMFDNLLKSIAKDSEIEDE